MLEFLKNHPFPVEAFFDRSIVLTFAVPKDQLEDLIPECLTLDTFKDNYGFIAIAVVETKGLRPKGFPQFLGNDFILSGYRVFVRYTNKRGKRLRGLYIIKSETNKRKMQALGNVFTHYNYSTTDISIKSNDHQTTINSKKSGVNVVLEDSLEHVSLPSGSPFLDWKEARRFAGPMPFTFSYNQHNRSVVIIEGVRDHWKPKPIKVVEHQIDFLDQTNAKGAVLASAFEIRNVPYYWKKGKLEKWT